ncbi:nucleoside-binding protein [Hydrogenoanaerobacterium saccharovorans]|uniref:Nucleoside-binding protein n=1 Tax=Hydrogenoanaerobacterium saccharovorans TaxID=474960 RepID=A0A1H8B2E7_9FIRM|nr:BMP family ABC transporter substrate-binding protein [Hydrogenoanaerobacterium saccharovorans]RPF47622.1 nucleoside-binding protein [Hydrogenoanaerobacterium saccharovorans]SEM77105.1 nucleoside-binding protein [Hydrogenoanaerobacterium saccharovorans]
MKRILSIVLAAALALSMAACGSKAPSETGAPSESESASAETPAEEGKFELALITDIGTIDDKSFNQGSWEGLKKYAEEKNITHKYYKPTEKSTDAYLSAIDLAVKGGAKVIVTPGFLFEEPIFIAQDTYPDVKFILIDGNPHNADYTEFRTEKNAVGIVYAEEQAGYLAGYAAVKDGMTKLGFLGGMAVPAVVRYGYGFIQGADAAAKELGLADGSVSVNYHYTGGFDATPEAQTLAASWYQAGTQVIFACGGAVGNSAMAAAEQAKGKVIGVDVDQSPESPTVISSAMKGLGVSVYDTIKAYYEDKFPGGQGLVFSAANNGVSLPMDTSKFEKFTKEDYEALYKKMAADEISIVKDTDKDGKEVKVTDLKTSAVKTTVVE